MVFNRWLEVGDYARRLSVAVHGPFKIEIGCLVLEMGQVQLLLQGHARVRVDAPGAHEHHGMRRSRVG